MKRKTKLPILQSRDLTIAKYRRWLHVALGAIDPQAGAPTALRGHVFNSPCPRKAVAMAHSHVVRTQKKHRTFTIRVSQNHFARRPTQSSSDKSSNEHPTHPRSAVVRRPCP